jgi:putative flippase GtrA
MNELLSTFLKKPLTRYILVGGSAYIIEIAVIFIAQKFGANNILAVALSFWIGLTYSFILQKFFSFGDSRTHHKVLLPQILMVVALVTFNFTFTLATTALLQHMLPAIATRTLAIAITTLWNFYLFKAHIFRVPVVD